MTIARLIAALLFLCSASVARADALDDTLARFLEDKFARTEQGGRRTRGERAPNAADAILEALGDNRLMIEPVAHCWFTKDRRRHPQRPDQRENLGRRCRLFKKVRVNNALRSAIEAATAP